MVATRRSSANAEAAKVDAMVRRTRRPPRLLFDPFANPKPRLGTLRGKDSFLRRAKPDLGFLGGWRRARFVSAYH